MKKTPARREFKKLLGQANHFLITTLIGLDNIEKSESIKKPNEFSTSWEPHNHKRSAIRSREFVINSFLAWTVDALDSYLILIHRKPKLIIDPTFTVIMSKAGRSVYLKATLVGEHFKIDPILTAMMELLITWRNNLTHNLAENQIDPNSKKLLLLNQQNISNEYSGLKITTIFEKAYAGKAPTFKECASLINATHKFVEEIDNAIIKQLDIKQYSKNVYLFYFDDNKSEKISKIFGRQMDDREKIIKNILQNIGSLNSIDDDIVKNLMQIKASEILHNKNEINDEINELKSV